MTIRRVVRILSLALGVIAALYFVIGGIYVYQESQREKNWHDEAVAKAGDQTMAEWLANMGSRPVAEWYFVNNKKHTYVVRFFDDRKYVSAIYDRVVHGVGHPMDSSMPKRFKTGKVNKAEWRALQSLLETMYVDREPFFERSHRKKGNVTLAFSRNYAVPVRFRLYSDEYQQWPSTFRKFDDLLFTVMASWAVKPHHGYSTELLEVSYGPEELPNLIRVLQSEQQTAFAGIVSRIVALGEPARAPLIDILRSGERKGYLPIKRYIAVMDGLAGLDDSDGTGLELIKSIAETSVSLPGRKKLKVHATAITGAREVEQHIKRNWTLPKDVERQFRRSTLRQDQKEALASALANIDDRLDVKKVAAKATLIDIGSPILPAVLDKLKADQDRNHFRSGLLDVLAEVGGVDAFVYAIRENGMKPSLATRPLERIGSKGVAGLLMLLESSDKLARTQSFYVLEKEEYAAYFAQYLDHLARNLDLYRASSLAAVRALHTEAAINLIKLLQTHNGSNHNSIDVLLEAAIDVEQAEQTRILALNALAGLVPLPDAVEKRLRKLAGYESGKVYDALKATLAR